MIKIFSSVNELEVERKFDEFEENHKIISKQYSVCSYSISNTCNKAWHCLMVDYE
jgi:hypothetical protein